MSSNQQQAKTFKQHRISKIRKENELTKTFFLEGSIENVMKPGQFVMAWLPGVGEKPFGIMNNEPFCITVVDVGLFSHSLHQLKRNDHLWIRGPFGNGYEIRGKKALLVGGGYGTAPLFFLAKKYLLHGIKPRVIFGAKSEDSLILVRDFKELGLRTSITTEDGSAGIKGTVIEQLVLETACYKPDCIYACGPKGMLQAVKEISKNNGIACQLSWEEKICCAMGLCGSCELESPHGAKTGWLVCMDGPVERVE